MSPFTTPHRNQCHPSPPHTEINVTLHHPTQKSMSPFTTPHRNHVTLEQHLRCPHREINALKHRIHLPQKNNTHTAHPQVPHSQRKNMSNFSPGYLPKWPCRRLPTVQFSAGQSLMGRRTGRRAPSPAPWMLQLLGSLFWIGLPVNSVNIIKWMII